MRQKIQSNPLIPMDRDPHSTVRFLTLLKQPDPDPDDPFELDESDVVWSPSDLSDSTTAHPHSHSHSPPANSPTTLRHHHHQFHPQKSGLSAALSDDQHALVRRKPTLSPSLSAAKVVPTLFPRSEGSAALYHHRHHQSAPVNVPIWPKKSANLGRVEEVDNGGEVEEEEEMVPPHVIVARSHVMAFSVLEGVGRTLKGRDLRRVRNAVFRETGFID